MQRRAEALPLLRLLASRATRSSSSSETEALDFVGALEFLAERYNVELKREDEDPEAEQRRLRKERLLKLVDRAADLLRAGAVGVARGGAPRAST